MSEVSVNTEGTSQVKPAVLISPEAIQRLNSEGMRYEWEPLRIVDEGRVAMARMPEGQVGIVIGSGDNTTKWRARGWDTLDIDPTVKADMTIDANELETAITPGSQDYLLAECVTFKPLGEKGVSPARLLQQANKGLKIGGILMVETASFENHPKITIPNRFHFPGLMVAHGFDVVIEVDTCYHSEEDQRQQRVVYYGKKVAEGFDKSKIGKKSITSTSQYDSETGKPIQ